MADATPSFTTNFIQVTQFMIFATGRTSSTPSTSTAAGSI